MREYLKYFCFSQCQWPKPVREAWTSYQVDDVTCESWCLKLPAIQLSLNSLYSITVKKRIIGPLTGEYISPQTSTQIYWIVRNKSQFPPCSYSISCGMSKVIVLIFCRSIVLLVGTAINRDSLTLNIYISRIYKLIYDLFHKDVVLCQDHLAPKCTLTAIICMRMNGASIQQYRSSVWRMCWPGARLTKT